MFPGVLLSLFSPEYAKESSIVSALRKGQVDIFESLVDTHQWDVNKTLQNFRKGEDAGFCLLHLAAMLGNIPASQFLLKRGALVDASSVLGMTPAFLAAKNGDKVMVSFLAQHGADIHRNRGSIWFDNFLLDELNSHHPADPYRGDEYTQAVVDCLSDRFPEPHNSPPRRPRM